MDKTKRPYIVCHMIQSIDGKAVGDFLMRESDYPITDTYEGKIKEYQPNAIVGGSTSLSEGFCSQTPLDLSVFEGVSIPDGDFVADSEKNYYMITIDRIGKMHWRSGYTDPSMGIYGNAHIISILTQQATKEYRAYLRSIGVSYLVAGENEINISQACQRLTSYFNIHKMLILGGPKLNGVFAMERLIDELSLVVAPCIAGSEGDGSIVMTNNDFKQVLPWHLFSLEKIELLQKSVLWLNYKKSE